MSTITTILLAYFVGGLVILFIFDLLTKRIRNNMQMAGTQAQIRMAEANNPISPRIGLIMMLVLIWLFWPLVLIGAATDTKGDSGNGKTEETAQGESGSGAGALEGGNGKSEADGGEPSGPSDFEAC